MAEISPLRRRMIEDMTVRNLSPATQRSYFKAHRGFQVYVLSCHKHLVCGTIENDQGSRRLRAAEFNLVPETVS
jgi:hypothetical protein